MMVRLGNFLFRYRNCLFPAFYLLLFWKSPGIFDDYGLAIALGITLAVAGQLLRALTIGLAYIVRGGKDRQVYARGLVIEGIFAHCRNPLYLGNFLILCGLGFVANSLWFAAFGLPLFAFAYGAIIAAEEDYLRRKFGQEYEEYCAQVHRFVPKLAGLRETLQGMDFKWRRLLVKEYGTAFAWMAGMLLLVMKRLWLDAHGQVTRSLLMLQGLVVMLVIAYFCARYVKKRGIVRAD